MGADYAPHVSACPPHIFRPKAAEVGSGVLPPPPDCADQLILSQTIYGGIGGQIMLLTFISACPKNFQTYFLIARLARSDPRNRFVVSVSGNFLVPFTQY